MYTSNKSKLIDREERFFNWMNSYQDDINHLINIVRQYIHKNHLVGIMDREDSYDRFIYYIFARSSSGINPKHRINMYITKYPTNDPEICREIDNMFEIDFERHIMNIHLELNRYREDNRLPIYDKYCFDLYYFIKKYSSIHSIYLKEIKDIENEEINKQEEEEFTTEVDEYPEDAF